MYTSHNIYGLSHSGLSNSGLIMNFKTTHYNIANVMFEFYGFGTQIRIATQWTLAFLFRGIIISVNWYGIATFVS